MAWLYLALAIVVEVAATSSMPLTQGFSKPLPTAGVLVGYGTSFFLMAQALKELEVGTAYAVWSGVGTALVALIGVLLLGESVSVAKVSGIVLIIAGVVVLNLGGAH